MGINVLAPDVNESFVEFAVVPGKLTIRFGMAAIKGVGVGAVEEILRVREEGKFVSVEDFARRVSTSKFNKRAWESLIKTGGFDQFGSRSDLLFNLESIQGFASKLQKEAANGQTDLFGNLIEGSAAVQRSITLQSAPSKHTPKEQLTWERELLGLYVSAHPLDEYELYLSEQTIPLSTLVQDMDGKTATIGGIVISHRTIVTKSGSKMAFVGLEDKYGESEIIVFPELYKTIGKELAVDMVIRAEGRLNARDREGNLAGDVKLIANDIFIVSEKELMEYEPNQKKMKPVKIQRKKLVSDTIKNPVQVMAQPESVLATKLFLHVKDPDDHSKLGFIKTISSKHPGMTDVVLVLGDNEKSAIKLPFRIEQGDALMAELVKMLGEDCVTLK